MSKEFHITYKVKYKSENRTTVAALSYTSSCWANSHFLNIREEMKDRRIFAQIFVAGEAGEAE